MPVPVFDRRAGDPMVTLRNTSNEVLSQADARRGGVIATVRLGADTQAHLATPRFGGGREIALRTQTEIDAIRDAALIARTAVDAALRCAVVGTTPASLASIASGIIAAARAESLIQCTPLDAFPDSRGHFPAACCVAVNDRLIHAVPSDEPLRDGDVVTVDVAVRFRGWCADIADCVIVGRGGYGELAMVNGCREMLDAAVSIMAPGVRWSKVAQAMQDVAQSRSLGMVTSYAGHGIGRDLHEAPIAPSAVDRVFLARDDFTLLPDMVLSVEPTVVRHADGIQTVDADGFAIGVQLVQCDDGWTMRTESGLPGCAVERTVVITRTGCEILDEARASVSIQKSV
ncbi:MAG: M24 family metallopeptidase [Phycisphaerales bacterium]|nr:M24 family metallopeptidase [Phycisphaerales bacterium]